MTIPHKQRGNAVLIAIIGLLGVVLAALINKGILFPEEKTPQPKTPQKTETPQVETPVIKPPAFKIPKYEIKKPSVEAPVEVPAPTVMEKQGPSKAQIAACEEQCSNPYPNCIGPVRRKLNSCLDRCQKLCDVCKSDICFENCERCQSGCSEVGNMGIDSCKEDVANCRSNCR